MPHSVTLQAGYTQKDLFFAAVRVQLEEFKKTQNPRCFESPTISEEDIEGNVILSSSEKHPTLVTNFYDDMKVAFFYEAWEKVRAQSPFRLNEDGKREAKLSTFNKVQLANFLAAIILQFKKDMTLFLSQPDVKKEMERLNISDGQLTIAASNTLQAIFAPLEEMAIEDEETRILYGFCTAATTKFCLQDSMVPAPGDTIDSACDAMLRQVSLTLTQPIGEEKCYGNMLGKDTPMSKMEGALLGTELTYNEKNISIPKGSYYISDKSFRPAEELNDEEIFQHVVLLNLNFLKQVNHHETHGVFRKIMLQRLWGAFFTDKRCPVWLKNKKDILLAMIEKKNPPAKSVENITLAPEYTKSDLILAAIEMQIPLYGAEGEENTNNARIFEAAKVTLDEDYGITVSSSSHNSGAVSQFEDSLSAAVETEAWRNVREKFPIQVADKGTEKERLVIDDAGESRQQFANYLAYFAVYFQKLWPEIQKLIEEKNPKLLPISQELILSLAVFLNKSLTPATEMGTPDEKLRSIISFLSLLQNRCLKKENLIKSDSADDICHDIMRLASLMVTRPIGDEQSYGGVMGTSEKDDLVAIIFGEDADYCHQFERLERYIIPDECFNVPRGGSENEQMLQNFFTFNLGFLRQVDFQKFPPEMYQVTLQRLWNAYIADSRCLEWIKEQKDILEGRVFQEGAQEKYIILGPLTKVFSSVPDYIKHCNRNNNNSLQSELKALAHKTLLTLIKSAKIIYPDEMQRADALDFVKDQLQKLITQYAKEKTLNAGFCSEVLTEVNNFITSFEGDAIFSIEDMIDSEDFSQKRFFLDAFDKAEMRFLSMTPFEKERMLTDIIALRGAISDDYLVQILQNLVKYLNIEKLKKILREVPVSAVNSLEKLLIFTIGELWITAGSQKSFTKEYIQYVLEENVDFLAEIFKYSINHASLDAVQNIFNAVLVMPAALDNFSAKLWRAAYKSEPIDLLVAALSCHYLPATESTLTFEEDYRKNLCDLLDKDRMGDRLELPEYYSDKGIENCIIEQLNKVEKFKAKKSMIALMQSDLPLHVKLRFVGVIAEGKSLRNSSISLGRVLYQDLRCFYMVRVESDVASIFKDFLIERKKDSENIIDIEHNKQRLTLIQAQKDNVMLPEDKRKSFEILFMRWVKFSKASGDIVRKEDLVFGVSPTQEDAQRCYETIINNNEFGGQQKIAFIESLRICCLKNSENGEDVWKKINKGGSIESLKNGGDLKTLLDLYANAKKNGNATDSYTIADQINVLVPKSELDALKAYAENIFPVRTSPLNFFAKKEIPEEIANIISLLLSEQSRADILLALKNKVINATGYQEFGSKLATIYSAVDGFLKSGKMNSLPAPQLFG